MQELGEAAAAWGRGRAGQGWAGASRVCHVAVAFHLPSPCLHRCLHHAMRQIWRWVRLSTAALAGLGSAGCPAPVPCLPLLTAVVAAVEAHCDVQLQLHLLSTRYSTPLMACSLFCSTFLILSSVHHSRGEWSELARVRAAGAGKRSMAWVPSMAWAPARLPCLRGILQVQPGEGVTCEPPVSDIDSGKGSAP